MRKDIDAKLRGQLELIYSTGERAASLTRQLLAFSRQQVLQPKVLSLNTITTGVVGMLQRLIPENIALMTILDPQVAPVLADPGQIEQVILNLVVNARDAMPDGGRQTIESASMELSANYCSTREGVKPGHYMMLSVSDSGTGMTPAVQAKIFEPFYTTKELGKGTGLGLSTVYGIVKQGSGHIAVYSELGKGSAFKIYLPCASTAVVASHSRSMLRAVGGGKERILLVEDIEGVRDLVRDLLEMNGYTVVTAANGKEALKAYAEKAESFHLLMTDVVMPQIGGPELMANLKRIEPGLKVLYTSGYTDRAIVHNGMLAAEVNFIQKPFTPENLATKVREILDAELGAA